MISRRTMIGASVAVLGAGPLAESLVNESPNNISATPELTLSQRRTKLRNWFKKHTSVTAPQFVQLLEGGNFRVRGDLIFEDGRHVSMSVGFDPDESEEIAAEFRTEFNRNAVRFCPSVPVTTEATLDAVA